MISNSFYYCSIVSPLSSLRRLISKSLLSAGRLSCLNVRVVRSVLINSKFDIVLH